MIGPEDARQQGKAFVEAAESSPVLQIATVLKERGKEYLRAADELDLAFQMDKRATIVMVGTVEAGMTVMGRDAAKVLRVLKQGGDISLQVNDQGQVSYLNFVAPTSPVVVLF